MSSDASVAAPPSAESPRAESPGALAPGATPVRQRTAVSPSDAATAADAGLAWQVFFFMLCAYLLALSREHPWADARVMWETAVALVDHRSLELKLDGSSFFFAFKDNKKFGLYPLGYVLALTPSYALYKLLALIPKAPTALLLTWFTHLTSVVCASAACALFFRVVRRQGARVGTAIGLSIGLGVTSILAVYARQAYSESLQTLLLLWTVSLAFQIDQGGPRLRRHALALGFAAGWLVNVKAVNVLPLGVTFLWLLWRLWPRRADLRQVALLGLPTAILWAAVMLANNALKTGSPFDTGYSTAAGTFVFSGRGYDAVLGFLLSPGKSVFLHSPLLIAGAFYFPRYLRERRPQGLLLLGVCLAVFAPHSIFHSWYGGWPWGPRYLVAITPLLLLPAVPYLDQLFAEVAFGIDRWRVRIRRAAVYGLTTAGVFVQVAGCSIYWDFYVRIVVNLVRSKGQDEIWAYVSTVFIPSFSPIVGHWWLLWHFMTGNKDLSTHVPWFIEVQRKVDLQGQWVIPLDYWVVDWFGPAGSPRVALAMIAVFSLGLLITGTRLLRAWRR